ncbi:MAG TPA: DNA recombination protein RmuC, partial [Clostridiales bacterium]|nr:DNA recombination protein RmuC [Clostridiales bacterium]
MRSMEIMILVCSMITCLFAILACFMAWKASRSHRASEDRVVLEKKLLELRGDIVSTQQTTVTQTAAAAANLISGLDNRMANQARNDAQLLEAMRNTIDEKLNLLRTENNKQLDEIKKTVDEKLQSTLEERISRSFKTVSERLEEVYKGLGEMKNLAVGVGDLKKVLSNVKTRGILGEIQLEAILSEILSPEQYETNIAT